MDAVLCYTYSTAKTRQQRDTMITVLYLPICDVQFNWKQYYTILHWHAQHYVVDWYTLSSSSRNCSKNEDTKKLTEKHNTMW